MPRVFGALPGPRNVPKDKQHLPNNQRNLTVSVTALTDAGGLSELLPPDCALDGEALLTVTITYMSNIGWLAGHGYAILSVGFSIAHSSRVRGMLSGSFKPVLWENLADPIVTGREELGFAKLYADLPPPIIVGDSCTALAAWRNFRFFATLKLRISRMHLSWLPQAEGSFHHKYVPKTGALTERDVDYLGIRAARHGCRQPAIRTYVHDALPSRPRHLRIPPRPLGRHTVPIPHHQRTRRITHTRIAKRDAGRIRSRRNNRRPIRGLAVSPVMRARLRACVERALPRPLSPTLPCHRERSQTTSPNPWCATPLSSHDATPIPIIARNNGAYVKSAGSTSPIAPNAIIQLRSSISP